MEFSKQVNDKKKKQTKTQQQQQQTQQQQKHIWKLFLWLTKHEKIKAKLWLRYSEPNIQYALKKEAVEWLTEDDDEKQERERVKNTKTNF